MNEFLRELKKEDDQTIKELLVIGSGKLKMAKALGLESEVKKVAGMIFVIMGEAMERGILPGVQREL